MKLLCSICKLIILIFVAVKNHNYDIYYQISQASVSASVFSNSVMSLHINDMYKPKNVVIVRSTQLSSTWTIVVAVNYSDAIHWVFCQYGKSVHQVSQLTALHSRVQHITHCRVIKYRYPQKALKCSKSM